LEYVRLATGLFYFTHIITTADWQSAELHTQSTNTPINKLTN
jgi:hypothetical protein